MSKNTPNPRDRLTVVNAQVIVDGKYPAYRYGPENSMVPLKSIPESGNVWYRPSKAFEFKLIDLDE